jgi:hypothetical protein
MANSHYQGLGEILQGNSPLGKYQYELTVAEDEKKEWPGVLYVGNRAAVLSVLAGTELTLRLEDGSLCPFHITGTGSKMAITVTKPVLH